MKISISVTAEQKKIDRINDNIKSYERTIKRLTNGKDKYIAKLGRSEYNKELKHNKRLLEMYTNSLPASARPKVTLTNKPGSTNPKDYAYFDPKVMKGEEWFKRINGKSKKLPNIEGYWRSTFKTNGGLPFPVPMAVEGYSKGEFLKALRAKQRAAKHTGYHGYSPHRWTNSPNMSGEYKLGKWAWPEGYETYVKAGVPPSRAFYKFITGNTNSKLPTYGG